MTVALYEFPLCEKVRNYLRLEQLLNQLDQAQSAKTEYQYLYFLEVLFNIIDLVERLDLRTDFLRDIDSHEKKLVQWSQHPDIDSEALEVALQNMHRVGSDIKKNQKLGASLKEERFLVGIKQRFSIPGGATSFDLPSLFCWLKQTQHAKQNDIAKWKAHLKLIENSLAMLLSFLREKGPFQKISCTNGYYQGSVEEKIEMVRIKCDSSTGIYPTVSGSRNRFGVKFMQFDKENGNSLSLSDNVEFKLSCC